MHSLVSLPIHFVFATRGREPWIDPAWAADLYAVAGIAAVEKGCRLLAAGGVADHVHLLISLGRAASPGTLMAAVKATSSGWAAARQPGFAWQTGYAAFGVGRDGLGRVKAYIADQEWRHATQTFRDELEWMLAVHGVEWAAGDLDG